MDRILRFDGDLISPGACEISKMIRGLKLAHASCILICLSLLSNCSIHPVLQDVMALDTKAVVRKIKCEARDALRDQVEEILRSDEVAKPELKAEWIYNLHYSIEKFPELKNRNFGPRVKALLEKYSKYLMYFDFTFKIYEDNNTSTDINLLSTLTAGSNGLNLKASNDRRRQNTTVFRVRNTFQEIIANKDCHGISVHKDLMYPIAGDIGLYEVIDTFLHLNEENGLSVNDAKDKVQLYASTLSFTTTFSGSAGPKVTLSPVGKPISLADASFLSTSTRSDLHEVIVGMSLPSNDKKDPAYIASQIIVPGQTIDPLAVRAANLDEYIDQQIRRNLILNLVTPRGAAVGLF